MAMASPGLTGSCLFWEDAVTNVTILGRGLDRKAKELSWPLKVSAVASAVN